MILPVLQYCPARLRPLCFPHFNKVWPLANAGGLRFLCRLHYNSCYQLLILPVIIINYNECPFLLYWLQCVRDGECAVQEAGEAVPVGRPHFCTPFAGWWDADDSSGSSSAARTHQSIFTSEHPFIWRWTLQGTRWSLWQSEPKLANATTWPKGTEFGADDYKPPFISKMLVLKRNTIL